MRCLFIRRHKYRTPEVRTVALEGEFDILVGSVIEFGAGEFKTMGQPVEPEVNFTDDKGGSLLDWETTFGE